MGTLLLVAVTPDEESRLAAVVGAGSCRSLAVSDLRAAIGEDADAVVIGGEAPSPLAAVQWVHRAQPLCGVVLLTTRDTDAELRRSAMYAPDMPASLTILESTSPELGQRVKQVLEAGRSQRAHHETLSSLTSRATSPTPHTLAPASLGALLDHAPFGVLVGDLDGRLVTWNRWAGDLLELSNDAAGEPIPGLFPPSDYLTDAFALARAGRMGDEAATDTLEGPGDTAVEVSTAPTRLESGEPALLVLVQDVTTRTQAERTRDRLAEHVGLLGRVSEALAGTLDVDRALSRLADQVVPTLADWVSIQTHDERGLSGRRVVRYRDSSLEREAAGSVLEAPLPGRDDVRGSMRLVRAAGSPAYTPQDQAVALEVGRRAGVALDTLSLYARERDLAAELQRSLLTEPPETEHAEVVVRYVAAAEEAQVGGDWYDAFIQADGSTVLVIGDVMGHDNRAAAAMGQIRALLRGIGYTTGTGPAEMLSRLDAAIEGLRVQTTATGLVVRVDPRTDAHPGPTRLCWSNAGHPPPIVVPPEGGAVALEHAEPDLLLGVLADVDRQEARAVLEPGGTLLLYTDGLVERRRQSIDEGLSALTASVDRLAGLPLETMCDRLLTELLPENHDDDVALVAVRLRAPGETGAVPQ